LLSAWAPSAAGEPEDEVMPLNRPDKPVLLTGASGALGRVLTRALGAQGWTLRLTDKVPFPDPLPDGARFTPADLTDGAAILRLAEGCGTIVHFGGISVEQPFETVIGPNIRGLYHAYEAARRECARMVFASSNHLVGFHQRSEVLDDDCAYQADGYYGLSKAYGELMGRLYWDKHGVTSVYLRIGSCRAEPTDARMLSTWLSYGDLTSLVERATLADVSGCHVVWGTSANTRMTWWRDDSRELLGWVPRDNAELYADRLAARTSGDAIAERHQGGGYCAIGYSRDPDGSSA
jgi:uronate dehydrogenase